MFNSAAYRSMYDRFMGPLAKPVTLMVNNGTGFDSYAGVQAHVSKYRETDLVTDGPIKIGDLRLIIPSDGIPVGITKMEQKDRIDIDGRAYSVVMWDSETRAMGADGVAVEVAVRG